MDNTRSKGTKRQFDKVPWFGSVDNLYEFLKTMEERLEKLTAAGPKVEFAVDMMDGSITHEDLSLHDVPKHAGCRVKTVTVEGHASTEDQRLGTITLAFDKGGLSAVVSSPDTDWVDSTIACIQREARKSQSRWFAHKSATVRWFCGVMSVVDAAVVGSLVAFSIRALADSTPRLLIGLAAFVATAALLVTGSLRMRLFEIVTDYQQALYVYLLRLLVFGLFLAVIIDVLINLAT
jgi:hypothetical protein